MEETVQKQNSNVSDVVVIGTGPAALRFCQKLNKKDGDRRITEEDEFIAMIEA